jgi:hypothetical protein
MAKVRFTIRFFDEFELKFRDAASGKSYAVRSVRGPTSFHRTVSMVLPSFGASGQRCPPRMFTG